jgi:hypothetical protein
MDEENEVTTRLPGTEALVHKYETEVVSRAEDDVRMQRELKIGAVLCARVGWRDYFAPVVARGGADVVSSGGLSAIVANVADTISDLFEGPGPDQTPEWERVDRGRADTVSVRGIGRRDVSSVLPKSSVRAIVDVALHLLRAVERLQIDGVVHFDIKTANVRWDEVRARPVLANFGVSFLAADLVSGAEPMASIVYVYEPKYGPWWLDVELLGYIAHTKSIEPDTRVGAAGAAALCGVVDAWTAQNALLKELAVAEPQKARFAAEQRARVSRILKELTWREAAAALASGWRVWDVFAVCAVVLHLMNEVGADKASALRNELMHAILDSAKLDAGALRAAIFRLS